MVPRTLAMYHHCPLVKTCQKVFLLRSMVYTLGQRGQGALGPFCTMRNAIIMILTGVLSSGLDRRTWSHHWLDGLCQVSPVPLEPKER